MPSFYSKVIPAAASEAPHVLDGLLHNDSALEIQGHATDTAGAIESVFALFHLFGCRFAPRIRDLGDRMSARYPRLVSWVEETIEETLTFYRLPREHHKHLKSTNMLERLNEEIRRRTHVVRIFPNAQACLSLVQALASETQRSWIGWAMRLRGGGFSCAP